MYLRMLAASRLYLDNVDHIQASWFSEGKRAGQIALHFGADDWGGTLFEENVHRAADYVNTIGVEEIIDLIRDAGFTPAQRTTEYDILKTYDAPVRRSGERRGLVGRSARRGRDVPGRRGAPRIALHVGRPMPGAESRSAPAVCGGAPSVGLGPCQGPHVRQHR